jgi:hypothetical protein
MKKHSIFILFSVWCLFLNGQEKKVFPCESCKFTAGIWEGYLRYGMRMIKPVSIVMVNVIIVDDKIDVTGLHFDYSFGRRFSLGIFYEHLGFFIKPNTENLTFFDKISFHNFGLSPKIKFINSRNTIIYFEILPVASLLGFQKSGLGSENEYKSKGIGLQLGLGWQQYFCKHFGIRLHTIGSGFVYETEKMYDIQYPGNQQPYSMGYLKPQVYRYGICVGLLLRF